MAVTQKQRRSSYNRQKSHGGIRPAIPNRGSMGNIVRAEEAARYDLRAMPTLYLLDKDKRVMLKDVPVEVIIQVLSSSK